MSKKMFILLAIGVLVLATLVYAEGSSTGRSNKSESNREKSEIKNRTLICEDENDVRDRIKCRLEKHEREGEENETEEACRGHNKTDACVKLYKRSDHCYNLTNMTDRKKCFFNESGVNMNRGGVFRAAPKEAKQNYVVLLLYELQQRIERMQQNNLITTDQATDLITKIVEIKKMILAEAPRNEIVVKINEFKAAYKSAVRGINLGPRGGWGNNTRVNNTVTNSTNNTI